MDGFGYYESTPQCDLSPAEQRDLKDLLDRAKGGLAPDEMSRFRRLWERLNFEMLRNEPNAFEKYHARGQPPLDTKKRA